LTNNMRVKKLLTDGPNGQGNIIRVNEGSVGPEDAQLLCGPLSNLKGTLRRAQKNFAKSFRSKINDYVYRKGNGKEPQTWPLIRKVVLHGPWEALSTGACLVDLPGVRDANVARANVSEAYLQHCHQIWVVAPIKRAVDDGTARELMGEQFKRRLLMDGNYGNVSFICTQTDDCETEEIMRDHEDVARNVPGRWEQMNALRDEITALDKRSRELIHDEEELKLQVEDAREVVKEAGKELKDAKNDSSFLDDDAEDESSSEIKSLQASLEEKTQQFHDAMSKLASWRFDNKDKIQESKTLGRKSRSRQKTLKSIAAQVRNEYSTKCLQDDFRAGLEELTRKPDGDEDENPTATEPQNIPPPLPDDYQLEVLCISSNDYLKIRGIKPASDGPPSTFARAEDTQIPSLRTAVHLTTARFRASFATDFVSTASDMLDKVKLCATEDREDSSSGIAFRRVFERLVNNIEAKIQPLVSEFISKAESNVSQSLKPSLKTGAEKGQKAALRTVTSWGSTSRRTRYERGPTQNGLYWSTYQATVRRDGVYSSGCAGEIDFNQELCDPVEKEFSADWQRVMDSAVGTYLRDIEQKVLYIFEVLAREIATEFVRAGMSAARLNTMANTANRATTTAIKGAFQQMNRMASGANRDLNRSLLPKVKSRMQQGYLDAMYVSRGPGYFSRMKGALETHTKFAMDSMFDEATLDLLAAIGHLVKQLASHILKTAEVIRKSLNSVYSVCWDNDQHKKSVALDPAMQEKIRCCRNKLIPLLNELRTGQDETMDLVGIEREELEFDVVGVDSLEDRLDKQLKEAQTKGNYVELLDSDDEEDERKMPAMKRKMPTDIPGVPFLCTRIKSEPTDSASVTPFTGVIKKNRFIYRSSFSKDL
jgi:hypothetical protein